MYGYCHIQNLFNMTYAIYVYMRQIELNNLLPFLSYHYVIEQLKYIDSIIYCG